MEATKLRGRSELKRIESFPEFSLKILTSGAISEIGCSLEELCEDREYFDLALRFGVADATLLFVSAREGCLLLTDEGRLLDTHGAGSRFQMRRLDEYLGQTD